MNNTTIVYVIRHGDLFNPNHILYGDSIEMQLSEEGKEEIKNIAEYIKKSHEIPVKIYTSFLQRTLESANIIAKILGITDIQMEKDLADSHISSLLVGKPDSIRFELYKKGLDEYSEEFVGQDSETRDEVANRIFSVFQKAIQENKRKCVALVSHGDPIRFLLDKLEHPERERVSPMNEINSFDYLPKGTAWKFTLDDNGNLLSKTLIDPGR